MSALVVGIDPSLTSTGVVVIKDGIVAEQHAIVSKPPKEKTPATEAERLMKIRDSIRTFVMMDRKPSLVLVEGLAFTARNTSALVQLAGLNYFIREILIQGKVPFVIVSPTSLKKFATGKGNVDKNLIMMEVYKRWNFSPENSDVCDAFVLAQIGLALCREPALPLIKPQTEVINLLKEQYAYENHH